MTAKFLVCFILGISLSSVYAKKIIFLSKITKENLCEAVLTWANYVPTPEKVIWGPGIACFLYSVQLAIPSAQHQISVSQHSVAAKSRVCR